MTSQKTITYLFQKMKASQYSQNIQYVTALTKLPLANEILNCKFCVGRHLLDVENVFGSLKAASDFVFSGLSFATSFLSAKTMTSTNSFSMSSFSFGSDFFFFLLFGGSIRCVFPFFNGSRSEVIWIVTTFIVRFRRLVGSKHFFIRIFFHQFVDITSVLGFWFATRFVFIVRVRVQNFIFFVNDLFRNLFFFFLNIIFFLDFNFAVSNFNKNALKKESTYLSFNYRKVVIRARPLIVPALKYYPQKLNIKN